MTRMLLMALGAAGCWVAVAFPGCGTSKKASDTDGVYKSPGLKFEHGPLPDSWKRAKVDGTALSFDNKTFGGTISVSQNCKDIEDVSLRALADQELVGIEKKQVLERSEAAVDGRDALDWVVLGSLDGVDIQMNLVILRTGNCVYDLNLVTGPESFAVARADFKSFVAGFKVVK